MTRSWPSSGSRGSVERVPEVRLLGGELRALLGDRCVRAEARHVRELLDELVRLGGDELAARLFEDDRRTMSRDLRVLVNGRSVAFLEGLDTKLAADDAVTLHFSGIRGYPGG